MPRGIPLVPDPPPSIDGNITRLATVPGWQKWDSKDHVVFGTDTWKGSTDLSAESLLAWDKNYLYVAARVTDDSVQQPYFGTNLWNGDGIMLMLDLPRQPEGTRDSKKVFRIGISPGNLGEGGVPVSQPETYSFGDKGGPVTGARVAARRTAVGYDIEAALPWKWLGLDQPQEGVPLAYDIVVADADGKLNTHLEKLGSLLTTKWVLGDPNRLIDAALGETTGFINPNKLVSVKTTPLGDMMTIGPGETQTVQADSLPKVKELDVRARLDYPTLGGGSPGMIITVNGTALEEGRIRNRLETFLMGTDEASSYAADLGWYLFYGPDFKSPAPFTPYYSPDITPFEFQFDTMGLWKPDSNVITIKNTNSRAKLVVALATGEQLPPKMMPPPVEPAPTGEIPVFQPIPPLTKSSFQSTLLPGGAVDVALGDRHWTIESAFSTTDSNWAKLGAAPDGADIWKALDVQPASLTASTRDFQLKRAIQYFPDHITVFDQLTNTSDSDLPILLKHSLALGDGSPSIYVAGRKIDSNEFYTNEGETPTSLALYSTYGIGLVREDDMLRAQGESFLSSGKIGLQDSHLVLGKDKSVTTEFSVYPLENPDPYLFINRIRAAWYTNFQIDGGGLFLGTDYSGLPSEKTALGKFITDRAGHFLLVSLANDQGTKVEQIPLEPIRTFCDALKEAVPTAKITPYFHCYLSENLQDKERFSHDRLLNANGTEADYGAPTDPLFVPREGSDWAKEEESLINLRFDKLGADGIYWDEIEYSASQWDYNPDFWDGVSGDIDAETHKLLRKTSNIMLTTQPWRIRMMNQIMQRGPLIGNGAPETRSVMNVHFPRFIETGSITNLTKGQLYTPIALGDHLTERTELDAYHDMLKALNYGCVYYWYVWPIQVSAPTINTLMYPITPMRLGPGFIIGQERILTNLSGYFGWNDKSTFDAVVFDDKGRRTEQIKVPLVQRDGNNYAEVRIPGGFSVALIRKTP